MPVIVSMLRGINLAGHHRVGMEDLRALYESQGLKDPRTWIQSGNVVFETKSKDLAKLSNSLNAAIEKKFGFRADAILRTAEELEALADSNPLVKRNVDPSQNLVIFLSSALEPGSAAEACKLCVAPEEVHTDGRHLFCYYPNGQGRSKLPTILDRHLKKASVTGTGRNWNTVLKLLEMAKSRVKKSEARED